MDLEKVKVTINWLGKEQIRNDANLKASYVRVTVVQGAIGYIRDPCCYTFFTSNSDLYAQVEIRMPFAQAPVSSPTYVRAASTIWELRPDLSPPGNVARAPIGFAILFIEATNP